MGQYLFDIHPLAMTAIADYVSAGKSDWYNWNPGYYMGSGIGQGLVNFGKDIYHSDWDSVAYKDYSIGCKYVCTQEKEH